MSSSRSSGRAALVKAAVPIGLLAVASFAVASWGGPGGASEPAMVAPTHARAPNAQPAEPDVQMSMVTTKAGAGPRAATGDTVTVHYLGTFQDGTKFDSSVDRNEPFTFVLGRGQVIRGWDEGILGMQVGERRKLVVPPTLAYGREGRPPAIPPEATLVFRVDLLAIGNTPPFK